MKELYQKYCDLLSDKVMPCYIRISIDESAAVNNCLSKQDVPVSAHKFITSQCNALWTFSAMYNSVENNTVFLDFAHGTFNFMINHMLKRWEKTSRHGTFISDEKPGISLGLCLIESITEYFKATGDERARRLMSDLFDRSFPTFQKCAQEPKRQNCFADVAKYAYFCDCLATQLKRSDISEDVFHLATEILANLISKSQYCISAENAANKNWNYFDNILKTLFFLIRIFEKRKENNSIDKCCYLIKKYIKISSSYIKANKKCDVYFALLLASLCAYKHTEDASLLKVHGDLDIILPADESFTPLMCKEANDELHVPRSLIAICEMLCDMQRTSQESGKIL